MTEETVNQSVDEQVATEAEAPLAAADAGVSAPTASTEETPAVTSVSGYAAEIPLADSAIGLATTAIVGADAESQSPKDQEAVNAAVTISPNVEESTAENTGSVPVEDAPVAGENSPQLDVGVGASVADIPVHHESILEHVEHALEEAVKEAEHLIEEVRAEV